MIDALQEAEVLLAAWGLHPLHDAARVLRAQQQLRRYLQAPRESRRCFVRTAAGMPRRCRRWRARQRRPGARGGTAAGGGLRCLARCCQRGGQQCRAGNRHRQGSEAPRSQGRWPGVFCVGAWPVGPLLLALGELSFLCRRDDRAGHAMRRVTTSHVGSHAGWLYGVTPMALRANVYVDGFNVYYAIRRTPYRWLDLGALFDQLLQGYDVQRIRYFTARIKSRPGDLTSATSQQVYLDALASEPRLTAHFGQFLASTTFMHLVDPPPPPAAPTVAVNKTEEKGSDVNLASWMLVDAYENDCDLAVLVTNDSDFRFPMNVISQRLGRPVGLVNPYDQNPSRALMKEKPTLVRRIRPGLLAASQFPDPLTVGQRTLHRPAAW